MTHSHQDALQLRITGEISPELLRAHELGEVIAAYEDVLAAVVARQHPTLKPDQITVGLVRVEGGSVGLTFATPLPEFVFPAALYVTKAIETNSWVDLPLGALKPLRRIVQLARQKEVVAHFRTVYGAESVSAVVTKDTEIPASIQVYGQTEIVAEVKRVGGLEPKVMLRTLQGDSLFCDTTEEIAKQLGSSLYEQVRVSGAAEWDLESLQIVGFEVSAVLPYRRTSPVRAFAALREQFGDYFAEIEDPNTWAVDNRHGEHRLSEE